MASPVPSDAVRQEADRLLQELSAEKVDPLELEGGFRRYSDAAREEVVHRVAATYLPPPPGRLLARLLPIRTTRSEPELRSLYKANLRSSDAAARKFSLLGLKSLNEPGLKDLAIVMLRDDSDPVLAAALDVLLPLREPLMTLDPLLRALYAAHRGNVDFHFSQSLLEGNGFGSQARDSK